MLSVSCFIHQQTFSIHFVISRNETWDTTAAQSARHCVTKSGVDKSFLQGFESVWFSLIWLMTRNFAQIELSQLDSVKTWLKSVYLDRIGFNSAWLLIQLNSFTRFNSIFRFNFFEKIKSLETSWQSQTLDETNKDIKSILHS